MKLFDGRGEPIQVAITVLLLAVALVYANSLMAYFAGDDASVIEKNDFVKSWSNLPKLFTRDYLRTNSQPGPLPTPGLGSGEKSYRPVVTLSYFIDYSVWKLNPFGYHLNNLILHLVNVLLVYVFVRLLIGDGFTAFFAALFFGIHPVNSETVCSVGFREDLLSFLFFMLGLILYMIKKRNPRYYSYSLVAFLLALFSKEMALTMPLLIVAYDCYYVYEGDLKRQARCAGALYLGYLFATAAYLFIWAGPMGNTSVMVESYPAGSFAVNALTMVKVVATYITWFTLAIGIHATLPDHTFFVRSMTSPEAIYSIVLVSSLLLLGVASYRKSKTASFAIAWFFLALVPVYNIVPIHNIIASRYLYLPCVGYSILASFVLLRLWRSGLFSIDAKLLRQIGRDLMVIALVGYSAVTVMRNMTWKNDLTLWMELVDFYPGNPYVRAELGTYFNQAGLKSDAKNQWQKALEIDPYCAQAHNGIGILYIEQKDYTQAVKHFEQALRNEPKFSDAKNNLAVAYVLSGNRDKAVFLWQDMLREQPGYDKAVHNLRVIEHKISEGELQKSDG